MPHKQYKFQGPTSSTKKVIKSFIGVNLSGAHCSTGPLCVQVRDGAAPLGRQPRLLGPAQRHLHRGFNIPGSPFHLADGLTINQSVQWTHFHVVHTCSLYSYVYFRRPCNNIEAKLPVPSCKYLFIINLFMKGSNCTDNSTIDTLKYSQNLSFYSIIFSSHF